MGGGRWKVVVEVGVLVGGGWVWGGRGGEGNYGLKLTVRNQHLPSLRTHDRWELKQQVSVCVCVFVCVWCVCVTSHGLCISFCAMSA